MDIQKEREAFEALYKPCDRIAFCFGLKKYVQLSNEDNDSEIVDHANQRWELWQAAKSKAVPDGYCVVPKEPTLKMSIAYQKNAIAPVSSLSISGYKAMIEAQEQK